MLPVKFKHKFRNENKRQATKEEIIKWLEKYTLDWTSLRKKYKA